MLGDADIMDGTVNSLGVLILSSIGILKKVDEYVSA